MDNGIKLGTVIEISMDGVWAGSGNLVDGRVDNCGAQFCDDTDRSLAVYDLIDAAIAAGKDSIKVDLDGHTRRITWHIHD
jgi:hypothetical protein